jgi:putative ABC transport system permease protein
MIWFLARRNLRRSLLRTLLLVVGVGVAGALLFDMSMLARGLETSFARVLGELGYEIRITPRGTLPLSTEAVIPQADRVAARISLHPGVLWTSPILATNLYVEAGAERVTAVALGVRSELAGIMTSPGSDVGQGTVANAEMARSLRIEPGDTIRLATRVSPQTGRLIEGAEIMLTSIGEFAFDVRGQRTLALPFEQLQKVMGRTGGQSSFLIVKTRDGADPDEIVTWIEQTFPSLDAFSIFGLLQEARKQLVYFRHFALVLSTISLLITLLLIGAILTVAVGERLGELATLRALGLSRLRMVVLIVLEGAVLAAAGVPLALLLGAAVSRPLEAILQASPGIPAGLHFFVMTSAAAVRTVLLLLAVGTLGAAYPAWITGRLNIAATLHQEVQ